MPSKESDSKRKKRSAKKRSLLPLFIFLILLLILSSGVLIYLIRNHVNASKGADTVTHLSVQTGFACEFSEAQKLYPFSNGVLKVTATRVAYLSMAGDEIYGVDIQMDNPFCVIRGSHALVADSGGYFCAIFDDKGLICNKQLTGAISFGALSADGMAGLIIEQPQTKGSVYLLDNKGNFLAQWNSVESGYPISISFSPDQKDVNIALVDTDGSAMQPHLKQIELPSADNGQTTKEMALYSPETSAILPSISYIGNERVVLAGISDVLLCSKDTTQMLSNPYTQVDSIFPVGKGSIVIYTDGVGQEIRMEYLGTDFTRGKSIVLGNTFTDADALGDKVVVSADDKILVIRASDLTVLKTISVDEEVIRIGIVDEKTIIVVTVSGVHELSI